MDKISARLGTMKSELKRGIETECLCDLPDNVCDDIKLGDDDSVKEELIQGVFFF